MVLLGLGSNVGDRKAYLHDALQKLRNVLKNVRFSRVFESKALLPAGAGPDIDMPYLNMVLAGDTMLTPQALLSAVKAMETELGRKKRQVWGPREIDIDILAMGDHVMQTPELSLPHRELLKRDFVLLPMADVAPDWKYPVGGKYYGKSARELVQLLGYKESENLRDTGLKFDV